MGFFGKPLPNEEVIKVNVELVKFMPACNIPDGIYGRFDRSFNGVLLYL